MLGEWRKHRCAHCGAAEGQNCTAVGSDQPLRLIPAHPTRMEKAGERPNYQRAVETVRGGNG